MDSRDVLKEFHEKQLEVLVQQPHPREMFQNEVLRPILKQK
jgi:hypothetical protein